MPVYFSDWHSHGECANELDAPATPKARTLGARNPWQETFEHPSFHERGSSWQPRSSRSRTASSSSLSKYGGTEVKYDGQEYLLLNARDILAVVEK